MKIYACSDLHMSPDHFSDQAKLFLEEARQEANLICSAATFMRGHGATWRTVSKVTTDRSYGASFRDCPKRSSWQGITIGLWETIWEIRSTAC
jgi:hypothetical protein